MSSLVIFEPKHEDETLVLSVNFTSQMDSGEAVSAVTCSVSLFSGTDADPSAILSGSASVSANVATQTVTAGTAGVIYIINFAATTNQSNLKIIQGRLAVLSDNPNVDA